MTDRRPGPPLFELLKQDQPDPDDGHHAQNESGESSPETRAAVLHERSSDANTERSGQASGRVSAGVSRAERSAATMPEEPTQSDGGVVLSMPRVYMLIALGAVVVVLVWAIAYKAGVADGKREMETLIPNNSP